MWKLTSDAPDDPELLAAYMRWVLGMGNLFIHYNNAGDSDQVKDYNELWPEWRPWPALKKRWLEHENVRAVSDK